jgi:glycosyltransferase involved in cell wall biosynthesis
VAQVGRLSAQKDYPTFLRAAASIAAELPDVDFVIVGEGEDRAALEALAVRLGLQRRVRFLGLRHDVPALLAAVDVLTLTSTFEGFPNALLEAMAMGAAVVATDVGGCREVVVAQESGLLVPANAPAAVAAGALRLLRDPALARRFALAARRRVEAEFAVETMARRTMAAYLELLRATRAPAAVAAA